MIKTCRKVISIHGQSNKDAEFVMLGGLDLELKDRIGAFIANAEFKIEPPSSRLLGNGSSNICNLGISRAGVQLELSKKFRDKLILNKKLMEKFAGAIRKVI